MTSFRVRTAALVGLALVVLAGIGACGDDGGPNDPGNSGSNSNPIDTIPPSAITDLAVYLRFPESIAIMWTAPGDDGDVGKAKRYDIRYSDQPVTEQTWETAVQATDEPRPKEAGLMQTMRIDGFEPSSEYHFAMKAFDEASNASTLSNDLTGRTMPEDVPPAAPVDLTTIALDDTTCMLIWTSPGDDGNEGKASQYDIRYAEGAFGTFDWESATRVTGSPVPKIAGEPDTLIVSGLRKNYHHRFVLKAADEVPNWSEMSNVARALRYGDVLAISSRFPSRGDLLVIVYTATADASVSVKLRGWDVENCYQPRYGYTVTLVSEWLPTGTYTYVYDFYDEETRTYWPLYGHVLLCWGSDPIHHISFSLEE